MPDEPTREVKACCKCKELINKLDTTCPHCQAKQPSLNSKGCIGCLIVFVVFLIIGGIGSLFDGAPKLVDTTAEHAVQNKQADKLKELAYYNAQHFVTTALKSPSTAKFESYDKDKSHWWGGNTFVVNLTVDAKNSFGATIRTHFSVKMEYQGDGKWKLISREEY